MAWTKFQLTLAVVMVVTGSINTLSTKWADTMKSVGVDNVERPFAHPFLQADGMFVGECLCFIAFKILYFYSKKTNKNLAVVEGNQDFNPVIFLVPAMCDMIGTSLMYVGLTMTFASSFQMLRGSVIVFTGLLSVAFLNRTLKVHQWIGIGFVIVGLLVVGVSDFISSGVGDHGANEIITGDELIILAQIVTATQMVYEEKYITKHNVPALQVVGWEGTFGFVVLSILLIPMYYIHVGEPFSENPNGELENAIDGFVQLGNNGWLLVAFLGTVFSIAFFNFAGVSVTKELSATTRMVLDSIRTLVVWVFSLAVQWQKFHWLQPIGFVLLIIGMFLYNDVVIRPLMIHYKIIKPSEARESFIKDQEDAHSDDDKTETRENHDNLTFEGDP